MKIELGNDWEEINKYMNARKRAYWMDPYIHKIEC